MYYSLIMNEMEKVLSANVRLFVAFAHKRLGHQDVAEDVVQECMLKALKAARPPSSESESMIWFYRILRRAIIDIYRRNESRKRFVEAFKRSLPQALTAEDHAAVCRCYQKLLPLIPENYRILLERIDLGGESVTKVAMSLGITVNALHVRLHRARRALRGALEKTCRACSKHGCLDCTCG